MWTLSCYSWPPQCLARGANLLQDYAGKRATSLAWESPYYTAATLYHDELHLPSPNIAHQVTVIARHNDGVSGLR